MQLKHVLLSAGLLATSVCAQTTLKGYDKANMDAAVRPGTDFYEYAAGGWMKAHPLTSEHSEYGQFHALDEVNRERIRTLIEELSQKKAEDGTLAQKIGGLYRLAMDSVRLNREGATPLKSVLATVNGAKDKRELFMTVARLTRLGVSPFFEVGVSADLKNAKLNLVQINQGGLTLGDRDYYLNDDAETVKVREGYKKYIQQLFQLVGYSAADAAKKMEDVLAIETRIAKVSFSATEQRDIEGNYHKMSYDDLLRDFPGIDWNAYLLMQNFPAVTEVSVNQLQPIHEVEKLWSESSIEALKNYVEFFVIDDASNALSDDFRRANFDFYGKVMSGSEQDRPRWKRAVGTVEGVLGMAVGKMYVERYFPEQSKQRMLQLVKNLQVALGERIQEQKWMGAATKAEAQNKLNSFYVKIGYPDKWRSYDGLHIDESLSFYENLQRAAAFANDDEVQRKVNKPVDRDEWGMTPQTINAYYDPTTNEICFPAGILQPPFFTADGDDALNYGAIGVVIGHEMTHGFDDQGAQFDKDGNLRNWWTEQDKKNFEQRTQRMVRTFDAVEVLPGVHVNGALTCGENIADHGGIKIAYQAFQKAQAQNPSNVNDGFTPEQRFFLSYALVWAGNARPEALRNRVRTDPHSPGRWRVNAALPQIDAWYKAFNIKKGDKLFTPKAKRVDVW